MFFCDGFLHAIVDEELGIYAETKLLRLHHFISTVFRSELNVAENGAGYFIKNGPKASAHHAILQGVVKLNGCVCKIGRTSLKYGDLVSLQLESEDMRKQSELMAWKGSEEVAKRIDGEYDEGGRQGRMARGNTETSTQNNISLNEYEMIKYYREKLGDIWIPEIHESAILQSLPLTLRVLKPSARLSEELRELGFIPATKEDFSLQLSNMNDDSNAIKQLSPGTMHELLSNTWIARGDTYKNDEQRLGVFLSEARLSNEIMQQELTSMLPVSILSSKLKRHDFSTTTDVRFLDLCAAPGSKTCQLLSALDKIMNTETDFTIVANEINPQRANWMRQRLHQQSGSKALAKLIVTCANGLSFANMDKNTYDYIICDVPCSGDGTIRKSPNILSKWSPRNASKNKSLQKELLKVGLTLLKPSNSNDKNSGFLVYSTCSLNPMENEEVLSEVLTEINGNNSESEYKFELVDLSDNLHSSGVSGNKGNFLRVLPAKAHGGFFVAGIKKILVTDDTSKDVISNKDHGNIKLVKRQIGTPDTSETTTISYSISPCTQQCCKDITEQMEISTVISSGVAVLYESKVCSHILAQGVPSLMSMKQQNDLVFGHVQTSHSELIDYHGKCSNFREILLPMGRVHNNMNSNVDTETLLIIEVLRSSSASDNNCQSFLLPARIVQVNEEAVVATILTRPQVYRRAIICQLPLNGELV